MRRKKEVPRRERVYLFYRLVKAGIVSSLFYLFRIFPIRARKIVMCSFEGNSGYGCNPKYIAEELLKNREEPYDILWLVNDMSKAFPPGVRKVKNSLLLRSFHLATAAVWIDNSKKELGTRKREGQLYINTWHGPIGFKAVGLLRGNYSQIAKMTSAHDCRLTDWFLSNSDWCTDTHQRAYPYDPGVFIKTGSPRVDVLINGRERRRRELREEFGLPLDTKIVLYAPTFRGGFQSTRSVFDSHLSGLDGERLLVALSRRFGGDWRLMLKLHPRVSAGREAPRPGDLDGGCIDGSGRDDLYEILAGVDALVTDFSSCAFDAGYVHLPVFLYTDDYIAYVKEQSLRWQMEDIPFPFTQTNDELDLAIGDFDREKYREALEAFFRETHLLEDGCASERVCAMIQEHLKGRFH